MFDPVRNRWVALIGLAALAPLAWNLAQGAITLETAALRALVLLVVLSVVDRVAVPLVILALHPHGRAGPVLPLGRRQSDTQPVESTPRDAGAA